MKHQFTTIMLLLITTQAILSCAVSTDSEQATLITHGKVNGPYLLEHGFHPGAQSDTYVHEGISLHDACELFGIDVNAPQTPPGRSPWEDVRVVDTNTYVAVFRRDISSEHMEDPADGSANDVYSVTVWIKQEYEGRK